MFASQPYARIGAACGIVFSLVLFLASGQYGLRGVSLVALVCFLPFLACLSALLRRAEGPDGWLAPAALAGGLAGMTLKLASVTPEIAIHRGHIADGTALHAGLQGIADAATDVCLVPFAVFAAATAVVALRTRVLPAWLAWAGAVTAVALVANAVSNLYHHTGFVPALLLFVLWTLVTSVVLLRSTLRQGAPARTRETATA